MTTMRATSITSFLAHVAASLFPKRDREADLQFLRSMGGDRHLHELDERILKDIGLSRQDLMSGEARRELNRLMFRQLW